MTERFCIFVLFCNLFFHFYGKGMVEPGQVVTQALKAEFGEEAMAKLDVTEEERDKISSLIDKLFNNGNEVNI